MVMRTPSTYQRYIKRIMISRALTYNFWQYVIDILKGEARVRHADYGGSSCITYFLHPDYPGMHLEEYHFKNDGHYNHLITWVHRMNNMRR